jgi:hypothetical protein
MLEMFKRRPEAPALRSGERSTGGTDAEAERAAAERR